MYTVNKQDVTYANVLNALQTQMQTLKCLFLIVRLIGETRSVHLHNPHHFCIKNKHFVIFAILLYLFSS